MRIGPNEILPDGCRVQVNNLRGCVVKHVIADNGVTVHTIKYTGKHDHTSGWNAKAVWKPLQKPITRTCNYSFIETL